MTEAAVRDEIRVSEGRAQANGLELAYEDWGHPDAPPMLLIMGLGTQLLGWPDEFCTELVGQGFRVIRFDNRDIGLSSKIEDAGRHDDVRLAFLKAMLGRPIAAPYRLQDMARDTVGLLDALGIERAHLVGASMGGMIAQQVAADRPDRTASLTSIMSSSGARRLPRGRLKVLLRLSSRPKSGDVDAIVTHLVTTMRMIGSPEIGLSREEWAVLVRRSIERSYYPAGTARQLLAILASGSREELLRRVELPSLVIHGAADPLLPPAHGKHTAGCIPGARLELIDGMGHDLPPALTLRLTGLIAGHARSTGKAAQAPA